MESKVKFYTRRKSFISASFFKEFLEINDVNYEDAMKLAEILKKYGL